MTKKDIFTQIIAETIGKSVEYVATFADLIDRKMDPHWHAELPDKEAYELLETLRKEKPGILAWLVQGAMEEYSSGGKTLKKILSMPDIR